MQPGEFPAGQLFSCGSSGSALKSLLIIVQGSKRSRMHFQLHRLEYSLVSLSNKVSLSRGDTISGVAEKGAGFAREVGSRASLGVSLPALGPGARRDCGSLHTHTSSHCDPASVPAEVWARAGAPGRWWPTLAGEIAKLLAAGNGEVTGVLSSRSRLMSTSPRRTSTERWMPSSASWMPWNTVGSCWRRSCVAE